MLLRGLCDQEEYGDERLALARGVQMPAGCRSRRLQSGPGGLAAVRDEFEHRTITLLVAKTGYQMRTARADLGRFVVADIGVPTELILKRLGIAPQQ
jgi:hypothetical protein